MKVQDILDTIDFTMDEFWEVVDALPEDDLPEHAHGKKLKKNVKAYFKKDGTLKAKAKSLSTKEDFQDMHDSQGFIRRYVRNNIHMNRQKKRVQDKLDNRGKSPKITDGSENEQ